MDFDFPPIILESFLYIPIYVNSKHKKNFWNFLMFSFAPSRFHDNRSRERLKIEGGLQKNIFFQLHFNLY